MNTCQICGKEISAKAKTCSDSCRKALSRARKKEKGHSSHSVTVTPEISQPSAAQSDVDKKLETLIDLQIANERRQAQLFDFLEQLGLGGFSIGQVNGQNANSFGINVPMPNAPLVLDDTRNQTNTFAPPMFAEDDLTALLNVKATTNKDDKMTLGQRNFINMVAAFDDPSAGYFDPNAKVTRRD